MIYLDLLLGFLKVGLFSFGGGYAAIPLIRDVVLSYGWISDEMLSYMIAVSESTPGPIMVNVATYVGSSQAGVLGAIIATLAVILPAFVIMIVVTTILSKVINNKYVQAVLNAIKASLIGIILATGLWMVIENVTFSQSAGIEFRALIITVILAVVFYGSKKLFKNKVSPIWLIVISAVLGAVVYAI